FFFSSRRRHTRFSRDWSSDVCSSDLWLLNQFPQEILGEKVYKQFGTQFPLLFKFIDACEDLSIQVHPNDELAQKRHNCFGKTEMWYIIKADKGARNIIDRKSTRLNSSHVK